jgi:peptidoglycan/LPS O-acetylase OafA/YrhL
MRDAGLSPEARAQHIPSLDGLRAVSIALVVVSHVALESLGPRRGHALGALGGLGVRVFFVISGFLITTLLLREWAATGSVSLARFYARRSLRIFPASYVYIAIVAALAWGGIVALHPHDLAFATTYTMSYAPSPSWWLGHLWSLSVEEQFYLLWPGVLALGGRRRAQRVAWAAVIGGPLLRLLWWAAFPEGRLLIGRAFPTVVDALAMGCLCAFREDWQAAARRLKPSRLWLIVVSLFLVVLIPQDDLAPLVRRPFRIGFDTVANGLIAAWLLGSVAAATGLMHRILNSRPMVALGMVSYSLYLWQQPFIRLAELRGLGMPFAVAGALVAATISYWLLERPLTTLRHKLRAPVASGL